MEDLGEYDESSNESPSSVVLEEVHATKTISKMQKRAQQAANPTQFCSSAMLESSESDDLEVISHGYKWSSSDNEMLGDGECSASEKEATMDEPVNGKNGL